MAGNNGTPVAPAPPIVGICHGCQLPTDDLSPRTCTVHGRCTSDAGRGFKNFCGDCRSKHHLGMEPGEKGYNESMAKINESRLPSVSDIFQELKAIRNEIEGDETDEGIDVRLQVQDGGSWDVHSGDASYDTDHRGHWGASTVNAHDSDQELRAIAQDLIDEVDESMAQTEGRTKRARTKVNEEQIWFDVFLGGEEIDSIPYSGGEKLTPEDVKKSLINHDGYDPGIEVKVSPTRNSQATAKTYPQKENSMRKPVSEKALHGVANAALKLMITLKESKPRPETSRMIKQLDRVANAATDAIAAQLMGEGSELTLETLVRNYNAVARKIGEGWIMFPSLGVGNEFNPQSGGGSMDSDETGVDPLPDMVPAVSESVEDYVGRILGEDTINECKCGTKGCVCEECDECK